MDRKYVKLETENGIGIITINRPEALNALNKPTLLELGDVLEEVGARKDIQAVIVTGAGGKAFVAGADIGEMQPLTAVEGREWGQLGQAVLRQLEELPQPVIAAIHGFALGGGCELALACDIRIAGEKAKFGQPEVGLGITAGFGGTQRLPRIIGKGRAAELLFTGDMIDAQEALRIGLVNKVVTQEEVLTTAKALAEKIISKAAVAVQLTKTAIQRGMEMDLVSGIAYEAEVFGLCFSTQDQKEGMSAFLEKRKSVFTGK